MNCYCTEGEQLLPVLMRERRFEMAPRMIKNRERLIFSGSISSGSLTAWIKYDATNAHTARRFIRKSVETMWKADSILNNYCKSMKIKIAPRMIEKRATDILGYFRFPNSMDQAWFVQLFAWILLGWYPKILRSSNCLKGTRTVAEILETPGNVQGLFARCCRNSNDSITVGYISMYTSVM